MVRPSIRPGVADDGVQAGTVFRNIIIAVVVDRPVASYKQAFFLIDFQSASILETPRFIGARCVDFQTRVLVVFILQVLDLLAQQLDETVPRRFGLLAAMILSLPV